MNSTVREIRYFHPSGKSLPNGSYFQRGGFLGECRRNRDSYILDKAVHGEQCGLSKHQGGVITFSTGTDTEMSSEAFTDKVSQKLNDLEDGSICSVGSAFKGKYIDEKDKMYDGESISVEVNGLSSKSLVRLAELLAETFRQETLLVKDLNNDKIFLIHVSQVVVHPDGMLLSHGFGFTERASR